MNTTHHTVKATRTAFPYNYGVSVDGQTLDNVSIKVVRCTARSQKLGLFDGFGTRLTSSEFSSALAAAKAYVAALDAAAQYGQLFAD